MMVLEKHNYNHNNMAISDHATAVCRTLALTLKSPFSGLDKHLMMRSPSLKWHLAIKQEEEEGEEER